MSEDRIPALQPPYAEWYDNLPPFGQDRVWAILERYEATSPAGVAETVFVSLCPGKPVVGMLETMHRLDRLSYVTGRESGTNSKDLYPGMRYWRKR